MTGIQHRNGGDVRRFFARIAGGSGAHVFTISLPDATDGLPGFVGKG
jgi:hypothetical protein